MPVFDTIGEVMYGRKYETDRNSSMSEGNIFETNPIMSAHEKKLITIPKHTF